MSARLAALLCLALAARAEAAEPEPGLGRDYQLAHRGWNGLSQLGALAAAAGCPAEQRGLLDWAELGGRDVLIILYPERPIDEGSLGAFLAAGGRALIADDFGRGAGALGRLGLRRREGPLPASVPRYRPGADLPIARAARPTTLGTAAPELVTNHPAYFEGSLPPTFAFLPGLGAVVEGSLGRGRFVALSDPSVLINNMLEIEQNRAFAQALVRQLCRPGQDRLLVLTGPAGSRGTPPAVLEGAPPPAADGDLFGRVNLALSSANEHIQRALARTPGPGGSGTGPAGLGLDAASLTGLCLAIAALLLCLRYLPLVGAQHDPAFAHAPDGGRPAVSLPQLVERYARREAPPGHLFPAALLREEVLRRLSPHLRELPRYGQAEAVRAGEVERCVRQSAGPRAGRLAAALWREFRTLPGREPDGPDGIGRLAAAWFPERRMDRLHRLAVALFAELDAQADRPTAS